MKKVLSFVFTVVFYGLLVFCCMVLAATVLREKLLKITNITETVYQKQEKIDGVEEVRTGENKHHYSLKLGTTCLEFGDSLPNEEISAIS